MTTDEMVQEIRLLYEAMHASPDVISETRIECGKNGTSALHRSYGAYAPTCTGALAALRNKLRAAASETLAAREAQAEGLRKALGIPSPAMAGDDLRAAVREYIAALRGVDLAARRDFGEVASARVRLEYAEATLRDAMGGEL